MPFDKSCEQWTVVVVVSQSRACCRKIHLRRYKDPEMGSEIPMSIIASMILAATWCLPRSIYEYVCTTRSENDGCVRPGKYWYCAKRSFHVGKTKLPVRYSRYVPVLGTGTSTVPW